MRILLPILLLMAIPAAPVLAGAADVPVTFRVTVPDDTPPDAIVHLAGDFQDWDPGHPRYRLHRGDDGVHELTVAFAVGRPLQFKFTLGNWARVEKGAGGEEIQNRLHVVTGAVVLSLTVARWADGGPVHESISGDVTRIDVPGFLDGRAAWVYLPAGYDADETRRYPVLYMLDGQNVFDDATSFAGEWKVDEFLERAVPDRQVEPIIVVAVANGGSQRAWEYTPWIDENWSGDTGGGGQHLRAIIEDLKPYLDARYRTQPDAGHTGLAGSSFGGLTAFYAAYTHADVFGRIAAFSPSLSWGGEAARRWCAGLPRPDVRLYLDMGTRERGNLSDADGNGVDDAIDRLRMLRSELVRQGFRDGRDLMVVEDQGGRHNEQFWARRFPAAVRFLFPMASD